MHNIMSVVLCLTADCRKAISNDRKRSAEGLQDRRQWVQQVCIPVNHPEHRGPSPTRDLTSEHYLLRTVVHQCSVHFLRC